MLLFNNSRMEGVKAMRFKTFLSIGVILLCSGIFALALDLRFTTAISQAPDPAAVGDTVTFTVSFKTFGGAVTNFKIIGEVDGCGNFERTYASIAADKVRTDSFTWTATGGSHTVSFELDPDHTCGDSDYSNNRIEKAIIVSGGPAGQPNLKPVISYTPANFSAGQAVSFSYKVENTGTVASVACQMEMKKGATHVYTFEVPVIAAGGHWNTVHPWAAECDAPLSIKVDSNNANAESNEGDNTWSKTMVCGDTGGGIFVCIPCLKYYKFVEFQPIPLPDPCLGCPPWHDIFHRGDPIDILNKIGDKLGQGLGFEDVKGDWGKFLGNSHGLTPNGALKIIFDRAVLGAKGKLQTEGAAKLFRNGLNNSLLLLHGLAQEKFAVK
jgi:hypothetical protein